MRSGECRDARVRIEESYLRSEECPVVSERGESNEGRETMSEQWGVTGECAGSGA